MPRTSPIPLPTAQNTELESHDEPWVHELAETLGNVIDAKDQHTWLHSEEVAEVSAFLALVLDQALDRAKDREIASLVHIAGHLHDIGKVGVPDAVLLKPGPLTSGEFRIIQAHPVIGASMIRPVRYLRDTGVVDMVLHHHERYDGTGYPHGLASRAIPAGARLLAVADSLSAMLQNRPYRKAMEFDQAVAELVRCRGTQFDPDMVAGLVRHQDHVREIMARCKARSR